MAVSRCFDNRANHLVYNCFPNQMVRYVHDRITIDPDLCNGKPTVRGLRLTVQTVLEFLAAGDSPQEVLESYPFLEMADIYACLDFALEALKHRYEAPVAIRQAA